jgi:hypothetical protein
VAVPLLLFLLLPLRQRKLVPMLQPGELLGSVIHYPLESLLLLLLLLRLEQQLQSLVFLLLVVLLLLRLLAAVHLSPQICQLQAELQACFVDGVRLSFLHDAQSRFPTTLCSVGRSLSRPQGPLSLHQARFRTRRDAPSFDGLLPLSAEVFARNLLVLPQARHAFCDLAAQGAGDFGQHCSFEPGCFIYSQIVRRKVMLYGINDLQLVFRLIDWKIYQHIILL